MKKIWIKSATLQDFAAIEVGDWIEGVGMIMSHFEKDFVRRFGACHKTSASTRKMDEKQANDLVKKLRHAAFNAGKHSGYPEGLIARSETKKAMDLGDEIVRHLTTPSTRPDKRGAVRCPICDNTDCKNLTGG